MRIVYVSADRGIPVFGEKGASIHIQEMIQAFTRLGHEVRCVTARIGEGARGEMSVEEVAQTTMAATSRADKERAAMAQAEAIEARLLSLYCDWPFDLIYERYSLWSVAGCRVAARLGVPVVTEVNAPLVDEQARFRSLVCEDDARAIEAEVLAGFSALAAVSRQVGHYLTAAGAPPSRVHVIGNAVDTGHFRPDVPAADLAIPGDAVVVGFTGSLKMWHGVDTLMEAFRALRAEQPRAHLLICGDGPKRGWIEGFISGAGLQDAVTLAGWVDHADLPSRIARMDIATASYPASDTHYFSPLKLYEYLAMGRPVVASDIGQTAELLAGSDAALLLPPGNAAALSRALVELVADPARRKAMGDAAAREGARHDWTRNAETVVAIAQEQSAAA